MSKFEYNLQCIASIIVGSALILVCAMIVASW